MAKRPETLTISLDKINHDPQRTALSELAAALGLRGISELARWLADTYTAAAAETVALLVAAGGVAAGGDEWDTLLAIRPWLPEITMSTTPSRYKPLVATPDRERIGTTSHSAKRTTEYYVEVK